MAQISKVMKVEEVVTKLAGDVDKLINISVQHGTKIKELLLASANSVSRVEFMSGITTTRFQQLNVMKSLQTKREDGAPGTATGGGDKPGIGRKSGGEKSALDDTDAQQSMDIAALKNQVLKLESEIFNMNFKWEVQRLQHELKTARREAAENRQRNLVLEQRVAGLLEGLEGGGGRGGVGGGDADLGLGVGFGLGGLGMDSVGAEDRQDSVGGNQEMDLEPFGARGSGERGTRGVRDDEQAKRETESVKDPAHLPQQAPEMDASATSAAVGADAVSTATSVASLGVTGTGGSVSLQASLVPSLTASRVTTPGLTAAGLSALEPTGVPPVAAAVAAAAAAAAVQLSAREVFSFSPAGEAAAGVCLACGGGRAPSEPTAAAPTPGTDIGLPTDQLTTVAVGGPPSAGPSAACNSILVPAVAGAEQARYYQCQFLALRHLMLTHAVFSAQEEGGDDSREKKLPENAARAIDTDSSSLGSNTLATHGILGGQSGQGLTPDDLQLLLNVNGVLPEENPVKAGGAQEPNGKLPPAAAGEGGASTQNRAMLQAGDEKSAGAGRAVGGLVSTRARAAVRARRQAQRARAALKAAAAAASRVSDVRQANRDLYRRIQTVKTVRDDARAAASAAIFSVVTTYEGAAYSKFKERVVGDFVRLELGAQLNDTTIPSSLPPTGSETASVKQNRQSLVATEASGKYPQGRGSITVGGSGSNKGSQRSTRSGGRKSHSLVGRSDETKEEGCASDDERAGRRDAEDSTVESTNERSTDAAAPLSASLTFTPAVTISDSLSIDEGTGGSVAGNDGRRALHVRTGSTNVSASPHGSVVGRRPSVAAKSRSGSIYSSKSTRGSFNAAGANPATSSSGRRGSAKPVPAWAVAAAAAAAAEKVESELRLQQRLDLVAATGSDPLGEIGSDATAATDAGSKPGSPNTAVPSLTPAAPPGSSGSPGGPLGDGLGQSLKYPGYMFAAENGGFDAGAGGPPQDELSQLLPLSARLASYAPESSDRLRKARGMPPENTSSSRRGGGSDSEAGTGTNRFAANRYISIAPVLTPSLDETFSAVGGAADGERGASGTGSPTKGLVVNTKGGDNGATATSSVVPGGVEPPDLPAMTSSLRSHPEWAVDGGLTPHSPAAVRRQQQQIEEHEQRTARRRRLSIQLSAPLAARPSSPLLSLAVQATEQAKTPSGTLTTSPLAPSSGASGPAASATQQERSVAKSASIPLSSQSLLVAPTATHTSRATFGASQSALSTLEQKLKEVEEEGAEDLKAALRIAEGGDVDASDLVQAAAGQMRASFRRQLLLVATHIEQRVQPGIRRGASNKTYLVQVAEQLNAVQSALREVNECVESVEDVVGAALEPLSESLEALLERQGAVEAASMEQAQAILSVGREARKIRTVVTKEMGKKNEEEKEDKENKAENITNQIGGGVGTSARGRPGNVLSVLTEDRDALHGVLSSSTADAGDGIGASDGKHVTGGILSTTTAAATAETKTIGGTAGCSLFSDTEVLALQQQLQRYSEQYAHMLAKFQQLSRRSKDPVPYLSHNVAPSPSSARNASSRRGGGVCVLGGVDVGSPRSPEHSSGIKGHRLPPDPWDELNAVDGSPGSSTEVGAGTGTAGGESQHHPSPSRHFFPAPIPSGNSHKTVAADSGEHASSGGTAEGGGLRTNEPTTSFTQQQQQRQLIAQLHAAERRGEETRQEVHTLRRAVLRVDAALGAMQGGLRAGWRPVRVGEQLGVSGPGLAIASQTNASSHAHNQLQVAQQSHLHYDQDVEQQPTTASTGTGLLPVLPARSSGLPLHAHQQQHRHQHGSNHGYGARTHSPQNNAPAATAATDAAGDVSVSFLSAEQSTRFLSADSLAQAVQQHLAEAAVEAPELGLYDNTDKCAPQIAERSPASGLAPSGSKPSSRPTSASTVVVVASDWPVEAAPGQGGGRGGAEVKIQGRSITPPRSGGSNLVSASAATTYLLSGMVTRGSADGDGSGRNSNALRGPVVNEVQEVPSGDGKVMRVGVRFTPATESPTSAQMASELETNPAELSSFHLPVQLLKEEEFKLLASPPAPGVRPAVDVDGVADAAMAVAPPRTGSGGDNTSGDTRIGAGSRRPSVGLPRKQVNGGLRAAATRLDPGPDQSITTATVAAAAEEAVWRATNDSNSSVGRSSKVPTGGVPKGWSSGDSASGRGGATADQADGFSSVIPAASAASAAVNPDSGSMRGTCSGDGAVGGSGRPLPPTTSRSRATFNRLSQRIYGAPAFATNVAPVPATDSHNSDKRGKP